MNPGPRGFRKSMANPGRLRPWVSPVLTLAALLVARASFADHYRVPSGSMEPTVEVGDHVCVNKLAYGLRVPSTQKYVFRGATAKRGEVVVLDSPLDGEVLLKRVVALPGDVVAVRHGQLELNGARVPVQGAGPTFIEALEEHAHEIALDYGGGPDLPPTRVPQGSYLVLGDNRGNSRDGRYFGWVSAQSLLGRASAVCLRNGLPVWKKL